MSRLKQDLAAIHEREAPVKKRLRRLHHFAERLALTRHVGDIVKDGYSLGDGLDGNGRVYDAVEHALWVEVMAPALKQLSLDIKQWCEDKYEEPE